MSCSKRKKHKRQHMRRILTDVNVWLATVLEPHPHHNRAVAWWEQEVVPDKAVVGFCRLTQMGFLRLLCNRHVMGRSIRTAAEAWDDYSVLAEQRPVEFFTEPPELDDILKNLVRARGSAPVTPGLWTDAYLAAHAMATDLELVTFDRGFRRFPVRTVLPR